MFILICFQSATNCVECGGTTPLSSTRPVLSTLRSMATAEDGRSNTAEGGHVPQGQTKIARRFNAGSAGNSLMSRRDGRYARGLFACIGCSMFDVSRFMDRRCIYPPWSRDTLTSQQTLSLDFAL